ncbi:MAG: UDP-glucose 4-epimerase GalE [Planctomycetota bacterium]
MRGHVLVTGGAGYIGGHCSLALQAAGYQPVLFDNLSTGHRAIVNILKMPFHHGDVRNPGDLERVFKKYKFVGVLHFAGVALVGESVYEPEKYYAINTQGGLNLLLAMEAHGVKNIVFSSTCATYGQPKKVPIGEDTPQHPINPYGRSKLCFETMLESWAQCREFRYAALRYFNACGCDPKGRLGEDHDPETHLIPIVMEVAMGRREALTVFGDDYATPDGSCIRDYIHVDDLADAHLRALKHLTGGKGEAALKLNLGTGRGLSVLKLARLAEAVTGRKIPVKIGPRRWGDPAKLVADPRLAQKKLGFVCQHSDPQHILETTWGWFRDHPTGYPK